MKGLVGDRAHETDKATQTSVCNAARIRERERFHWKEGSY